MAVSPLSSRAICWGTGRLRQPGSAVFSGHRQMASQRCSAAPQASTCAVPSSPGLPGFAVWPRPAQPRAPSAPGLLCSGPALAPSAHSPPGWAGASFRLSPLLPSLDVSVTAIPRLRESHPSCLLARRGQPLAALFWWSPGCGREGRALDNDRPRLPGKYNIQTLSRSPLAARTVALKINQRRPGRVGSRCRRGRKGETGPGLGLRRSCPARRHPWPWAPGRRGRRTHRPSCPQILGSTPRECGELCTGELMSAANKATVAGGFYSERESGHRHHVPQEASTPGTSQSVQEHSEHVTSGSDLPGARGGHRPLQGQSGPSRRPAPPTSLSKQATDTVALRP